MDTSPLWLAEPLKDSALQSCRAGALALLPIQLKARLRSGQLEFFDLGSEGIAVDAELFGAKADTPVQLLKAELYVPFFHFRKGRDGPGGQDGSLPGGKAGQVVFRDLF